MADDFDRWPPGRPPPGYSDQYTARGEFLSRRKKTWWDRLSNVERVGIAILAVLVVNDAIVLAIALAIVR